MVDLTRRKKMAILIIVDSLLLVMANIASYYFMNPFVSIPMNFMRLSVVLSIVFYLIFGFIFRVFSRINRYTNLSEMIGIFLALSFSSIVSMFFFFFGDENYSLRMTIFTYFLSLFSIISSRLLWRLYIEKKNSRYLTSNSTKNTLIVGAGEGGRILYNSFLGSKTASEINVIGFVDDDPNKKNTYLSGKKVFGNISQLPELVNKYDIKMITIAIPSLSRKKLREIFEAIEPLHVKVNTMPSMEEMASGKISMSRLKKIDVVDLLGRDEVQLDIASIKDQITDKTILVTGAGGSIGSEICRQVIEFNPRRLVLVGHGENSIYLIDRELRNDYKLSETEIIPVIADVQDRDKIFEIMHSYRPDIVYHAAAHKHVPLMEYNPREAVKNNIYGSKNVAEAAKSAQVKNFVMVSTDKANNPPNVMGATKRIAEMIVTGLNEEGCTKFSAVRFGNVLGSRGSVIPVFREQIAKGGPITVTDFRMTRYFMTIPEASRLVIQSGALAKGGEIFILDMSEPVKIVDLAKNMIRLSGYSEDEIEIVETGIRPGEKLYEELLLDKERNDEAVFEKIFVGNIKGYDIDHVMNFLENLSEVDEVLARDVVAFANASNK
ncbi:polysaccharide biosynthesis protein [Enterococcus casseliflavus]|uniref:polysaccharide biosynthesis protein n=1 Tax=Enterococcus casseliflavus TaxID=37734 RepID=UPI001E389C62|nr:nucleoside-diphosphate sugar epimerase/dehydratase [Enterococcus casseliflavus]MCD4961913.1 polysaccharide biosynthesis protein [Enterococcus casseliflavus]